MSTSTVSATANQGPTTRRRANLAANLDSDLLPQEDNNRGSKLTASDRADAILKEARKATPSHTQHKKPTSSSRKSTRPLWLTVVSILAKNLALLVLLWGFVLMIRPLVLNSWGKPGDFDVISGDFEGKVHEVEKFVKTTIKAMQVQVDAIDKKLDQKIITARKELDEKIEKKGEELELKLKAVNVRNDVLEKFMSDFSRKSVLSQEDFGEFFEQFMKSKKDRGDGVDVEVNLDEIKDYAREIVEREIERHAADGLGMVDYALASGGGRVVSHSEPFCRRSNMNWLGSLKGSHRVIPEAEKIIRPSFGEPGQCLPLKGGTGFVMIRLRTAILPEAITLEHVSKRVAYDRSSAPKHCIVSGYLQGKEALEQDEATRKMHLLTEFTYDLQKSNVQTFKVEPPSNLIDTVRLDIASNHGSNSHTCIYRLRVHGREPSVAVPIES